MFINRKFFCVIFISLFIQSCLAQPKNPIHKDIATTQLIQPPYLQQGDTVMIISPAGRLKNKEAKIKQGVNLLESWGLHVVIGEHVFSKNGTFAGTDEQRAEDFQDALNNPSIKAIWCARGGYGTVRILDKLDYTIFKKQPKWIIGYSDITALHNQIHNLGYETIHGIMGISLTDDLEDIKDNISSFKAAIFGKELSYTIESSKYNKTGSTSGQLVGGNLTLLHTMLGSKTSIDTKGKIIFFEDIGEYAYHIDRMLQSLKRAGYFENCKGIIVGSISKIRKNTTPFGQTVEQIILDVVADYNFPVLFNFPAGHEDDNRALILGRKIALKVGSEQSTVIFEE